MGELNEEIGGTEAVRSNSNRFDPWLVLYVELMIYENNDLELLLKL